jgi:hypothetical protein
MRGSERNFVFAESNRSTSLLEFGDLRIGKLGIRRMSRGQKRKNLLRRHDFTLPSGNTWPITHQTYGSITPPSLVGHTQTGCGQ